MLRNPVILQQHYFEKSEDIDILNSQVNKK